MREAGQDQWMGRRGMAKPIDKLGHEVRQLLPIGRVEDTADGHRVAAILASFVVIEVVRDRG
ncbi:MAG TPA: hypothetical protein VIF63_03045, partial [Candidatus Limnocylindrales bacterium]